MTPIGRQRTTRRYRLVRAWPLLGAVFLASCGWDSNAPSTPGTLELNVATTGVDIDADGFALRVDGGSPQDIPANGTLSVTALSGRHALDITGIAFNCDVTAAPTTVIVSAAATTRVDVRVACTPYLRNAIVYVSDQFGFNEVMVMRPDGSRRERLTTAQSVYFAPAVSPDGQSIAAALFIGSTSDGIYRSIDSARRARSWSGARTSTARRPGRPMEPSSRFGAPIPVPPETTTGSSSSIATAPDFGSSRLRPRIIRPTRARPGRPTDR